MPAGLLSELDVIGHYRGCGGIAHGIQRRYGGVFARLRLRLALAALDVDDGPGPGVGADSPAVDDTRGLDLEGLRPLPVVYVGILRIRVHGHANSIPHPCSVLFR